MNCPACGAEFGSPRIISSEDKTNKFGRRQITLAVKVEDYISYHPETRTYHCSKCGHVFSEKEAYLQ